MALTFKATNIDVGKDEWAVWVIDSNNRLWSLSPPKAGQPAQWVNDPDAGVMSLGIDGHGNVWTITPKGVVYVREASGSTPTQGRWKMNTPTIPGGAKPTRVAAGTTNVLCMDDQKRLWRYGGASWKHDTKVFNLKDIAVGDTGTLFVINEQGQYYKGAFSSPEWGAAVGTISGLKRLTAGFDNTLGYIDTAGAVNIKNGTFQKDPVGSGVDLAIRNRNDIWLVNSLGEVWRRTPTPFTSPLVLATAKVVVGGNQVAVWSRIAAPDYKTAKIYWIQPGNGLLQISRDLGIDFNTLKSKNPQFPNPDNIPAGEPLHLP